MALTQRVAAFFSNRNRHKKWEFFLEHFQPSEQHRTLDIGYSEDEWTPTHNYIEKHYPHKHRLTALGIIDPSRISGRHPEITFRQYDGHTFPFPDKSFDIAWSNAVLEHVGGRERQVEFLREIRRVSRAFFLTTPSLYFPVEVHTLTPLLHLFGKRFFDRYLTLAGKSWATGDYMHLLTGGQLRALLAEAGIRDCRVACNWLLGFPLEYWAYTPPCPVP